MEKILKDWNITLEYYNEKSFIREFKDSVNWEYISKYQNLSESFIREFKDSVYWERISENQKLSEDFIREFKDSVDWNWISTSQKLSESFIREFKDFVEWGCISRCQKISESFIREFKNSVNWACISKYQNLSESFIREFKDFVNWNWISRCQKISLQFMDEFPKINKEIQLKRHHNIRTKEEKLQIMKDYATQYNLKFENETLYCFREHDKWNRGAFNKTICYYSKGYYSDWHCDLDVDNGASFGLGAWPEGNTPISIHVNDFGCVVDNFTKIRCFGFTII